MNEKKLQTIFILIGCGIYFICLLFSTSMAAISLNVIWYEFNGQMLKYNLFSYRKNTDSEITTIAFIFVGLFTTLLEMACLIVLIFRVFGFACGKYSNKFLQFQMIFSCWTTFFWYMAIASFWILTPQRTVIEEIKSVHYDRNFRNKSNVTHLGAGFTYMCIALSLSFFSMIASVILETIIAPTRIEYRKTTVSN